VPLPAAYFGVGCIAVLAYFRAPGLSSEARLPFYLAVSLSVTIAIVVGVVRSKPARALPWILIAAGQLVYFAADVVFYTYHDFLHDVRYPAPADAVYLAHYPFLVAGLLLLGSRRRNALTDILIVGTAFALLAWILLMDPYTHASAGGLLLRLTSLAYPVMDLMVLFAALRLMGAGLRVPAMAFLSGALLFLLFSDFVYAWLQVKGRYAGPGGFLDATWLTYYLLLGTTALSPSMVRLSDARPAPPVRLGAMRLALLTAAALTPPVAAIVEHAADKPVHVYATAVASIVVFVLVVARLAGVASAQRRAQSEQERLLGRVVEASEHERIRLARDVSDGPIQKLGMLALRLDLLASQLSGGDLDEASASTRRVREELADEMESLGRLIANLRPPVVDERGIAVALRELAARVLDNGVAAHVASSLDGPLPAEIDTVLYRIAREALLNVDAHSQARRVDITLSRRDDQIVLSIRDDGRGFDASSFVRNPESCLGLTSMDDLARSLTGTMRVTSGRGAGTEVRVRIPLDRPRVHGSELSQVTSGG
jgi:signal transduction histidine kinase